MKRITAALIATMLAPVSVFGQQDQKNGPTAEKVEAVLRSVEKEMGIAPDGQQQEVRSAVKVQMDGNKLVITDSDGKIQEFDLKGAGGISISQSETVENKDGEVRKSATGKVIVVGPDGEKTEIVLDGPVAMEALPGDLRGFLKVSPSIPPMPPIQLPGVADNTLMAFGEFVPASRYFIGVMTEPVDETLRRHLGLEEGVGLVVREVTTDSPAQQAGLEAHDILLSADDKQLDGTETLVKVVDQSANDSRSMTLTLLRDGDEMRVEVTPAERPQPGLMNEDRSVWNFDLGDRLQPGIMIAPEALKDQGMAEELRQMADQTRREIEEMRKRVDTDVVEEVRVQMEQMRQQMEEARQQMERSQEMMRQQMETIEKLRSKAELEKKGSGGE